MVDLRGVLVSSEPSHLGGLLNWKVSVIAKMTLTMTRLARTKQYYIIRAKNKRNRTLIWSTASQLRKWKTTMTSSALKKIHDGAQKVPK